MNRISHRFEKPCRCQRIKRKVRRIAAEANAVEKLMGSVAEFMVPSVASFLSGDRRTARLFVAQDFEPAEAGDDLRTYAGRELRRLGLAMLAAADRLQGGAE